MLSKGFCSFSVVLALAPSLFLNVPVAHAGSAATATTLTMTSGTTALVSGGSVASGSQVNLTAAVLAGSNKVTAGQVSFCDATAISCTDIHLLGTAQLTSAGTAILAVRPGVGVHQYKAVFAPTPQTSIAYAASTSTTSALTVTGIRPSFSVLTYTDPSPPAYDLTAVIGGSAPAPPTGTVSFTYTDANTVAGTAPLTALPAGPNFLLSYFPVLQWADLESVQPMPLVVGDFNGDGFPDLAGVGTEGCTSSYCWDTEVGAAINDGTGKLFAPGIVDLGQSLNAFYIAAGDFNGDGKLDLAIGGEAANASSITILLGNGDGTFTNKGSLSLGSTAFQAFAVGDFNGDGVQDLAVANQSGNVVAIYLGNGDGTFKASTAATSSTGTDPIAVSVADFNGDGIADLAVGNGQIGTVGSVTILLGNGDGTFTTSAPIAMPSTVYSMAMGDFNGDGKADIVVDNGLALTMLTGKGDGTFTSSTITPTAGTFNATSVITGDFNGDGKVDLAFAGYGFLLMGNGDGTFDPVPLTTIIPTAASPLALQIFAGADFNGDGVTDLIAPASNTSAVQPIAAVLLASNQTSSATANGITIPAGVGSGSLDGVYPGDSNYGPSTTGSVDVIAPLGAPIVNVTASANSAALGSSITLTATVVGSGAPPVGTITFYDGSVQLAVAQLNSNATATYSTSSLPLGSNSITASYDGGGYYNQANSPVVVVTIFTLGTAVPTVTATASSATITSAQTDTVTVSVAGPAGSPTPTGTVVLTGANLIGGEPLANGSASFPIAAGTLSSGANTLTAAYSGDANYAPANGTVIVTVSPVGIAVPASSSVAPGASATATATLTADSSYSGTLNLTCKLTSSPAGATDLPVCSLAPASVSLKSGGGATSVLTVVTTAGSNARLQPINKRLRSLGGETALAMIFLCGISARRRRRWSSMLVLLSVAVVSLTIGCGGKYSSNGPNTPGTSAGNYVFTLTGTDSANAAITTSATVQIVVQ